MREKWKKENPPSPAEGFRSPLSTAAAIWTARFHNPHHLHLHISFTTELHKLPLWAPNNSYPLKFIQPPFLFHFGWDLSYSLTPCFLHLLGLKLNLLAFYDNSIRKAWTNKDSIFFNFPFSLLLLLLSFFFFSFLYFLFFSWKIEWEVDRDGVWQRECGRRRGSRKVSGAWGYFSPYEKIEKKKDENRWMGSMHLLWCGTCGSYKSCHIIFQEEFLLNIQ